MRHLYLLIIAVMLALSGSRAGADERPPSLERDSAADAAGAPAPTDADGIEEGRPEPSWTPWVLRVALFPVRVVVEVIGAPIRLGAWAADHYDIVNRITLAFFSGPPGVWIYQPVFKREAGFDLSYGVQLGHKNVFGSGLRFTVRALFGGEFRQAYRTTLSTREWVPETYLQLRSRLELRDAERFYGFGNRDLSMAGAPADPAQVALASRFRQTFITTSLAAVLERYDPWIFTAQVGHRWRTFYDDGDFDPAESISLLYDTALIPGYEGGVNQAYTELEAKYDTTGAGSRWDNPGVTTSGTVLLAYAGHAYGFADGMEAPGYQYLRYGATAVRHLRLTDGPRVLSFMGYVDAVRSLDGDVPFVDLPAMGGSRRLRGWHGHRFSDAIAVTGTVQYQFAVNRSWSIALFTDVGNVFPTWSDAGVDDLRVGYGLEWLWFAERGLLSRVGLGFSSEDTFLFNLSFSPSFAEQERL